jgi:hypothetical protein
MTKLAEWMEANGKDAKKLAEETGFSYAHVHRVAEGQLKPGARFTLAFWRTQQLDIEDVTSILAREAAA